MKRFLIFSYAGYYPAGGACDYLGDAETLENAELKFSLYLKEGIERNDLKITMNTDWMDILDTETGKAYYYEVKKGNFNRIDEDDLISEL